MINLITASGDWDKKFYARIACMNLYELTNDILELFGNDKDGNGIKRGVRPIVNDINDATLTQIINEIRQNFANFQNKINKNGKNYANVRNLSVAHRDHDFRTQYESINNLSWGEVIEDFMEFNTLLYYLRLFNNYLTSLFSVKYNQDIQPVLDSIRERMKETEGDKI
jgi:hypothetical protein